MRNRFVIEQLVRDFRFQLSDLAAVLDGEELLEAAHRAYEVALFKTPRPYIDHVHDRLATAMVEHGVLPETAAA